MSLQLIQQYYVKVEKIIQYGGSRNETAIRSAFQGLLEQYCASQRLELIPELEYRTKTGARVYPDGTVKDAMRQDWGYWESKDQYDTLEEEIRKKFEKGYPSTNILFEDGQTAVLFQNGYELGRASIINPNELHAILTAFTKYEPKEVQTFREAIERFKEDLPNLVTELRQLIEQQAEINPRFNQARADFLELCKKSINPDLVLADIREMIIQHVLTEEIFVTIFDESQFHQENNIARELQMVIKTFFTGAIRRNILGKIASYYKIIKAAASNISDHHEKQRFLKVVYENFYKAYNPAGAARLGIIYTPNEIVRFMIEASEYLTMKHFDRLLGDSNVEILDPATGTGTFITELIDYLPKHLLPYKYNTEIHCNEVAILPYYIANLNIEFTYAQKMGHYVEFSNICFVDTLDNLGFSFKGKQFRMFDLTAENLERIKRQNDRKISVIIGNPPYYANQRNENENNKPREYPGVDERIKTTYIKQSKAQKTKAFDMYTRFLRWASDRIDKNGVVGFVLNNSFVNAKTHDGLRKVVQQEFNEIYIIDLKGNAYTSGERRRREGGNVFSDQIRVGVALYFLVRKEGAQGCRIFYNCVPDYLKSEDKKAYLRDNKFHALPFDHINPDKDGNWINQVENEWGEFLPVATKEAKLSKKVTDDQVIFKLFSLGVVTARDEWVYGESAEAIEDKVKFLINVYNKDVKRLHGKSSKAKIKDVVDYSIKWSRAVKNDLSKGKRYHYDGSCIIESLVKPFVKRMLYFSKELNEMQYQLPKVFRDDNIAITFNIDCPTFSCLATNTIFHYALLKFGNGATQCLPLYRYDKEGNRIDNVTNWGLLQFQNHYKDPTITRLSIFHYIYAVLHNPSFRQDYELNLQREFPRIPFYANFWQWSSWGRELIDLHLNYESVEPYPLDRIDVRLGPSQPLVKPRPRLKADKNNHTIEIDTITTLGGIPPSAWAYQLGNRSALEWILERYLETKPKDITIAEKFNTYRFIDYKDEVIDLLQRVCTVSIRTTSIINQMT